MWSFAHGGDDQLGRVYIGTEPGGLFVSDDAGDTFQIVESLWDHPSRNEFWMGGGRDEPGIHSILVDPRGSNRMITGISCAGVFITDDGGQTWEPRNRGLRADFLPNPEAEIGHDPHLVVQCAAQPDVLWQQNHCGIFRSTDLGQNWTDVSGSDGVAKFGFTIAVDPQNGERAWVLPAVDADQRVAVDRKLCICRTEDGGKSWQTFRSGLPQVNCYDFALRHALDISERRLAFGTAGGSLYMSDDEGENWQAVANHLPPVRSVRFVS